MSLSAVRGKVYGIVSGVVAAGVAKDYIRAASGEAAIASQFKVGGILHTWMVSLEEREPFMTDRKVANQEFATYRFVIEGFYALNDANATEKTFQNEVESIVTAFRANKKLDNTVMEGGPAQVVAFDYRTFCDVLCHHARLSVRVLEQLEPTP